MRGKKPGLKNSNVYVLHNDQKSPETIAAEMKPHDLPADVAREWDLIAPELAKLNRLHPAHVNAAVEYCLCVARLKTIRAKLPTIDHETYEVKGRNGQQLKTHPLIPQLNETWRQWRNLTAAFGLTPTDERSLDTGNRDLFENEFNARMGKYGNV